MKRNILALSFVLAMALPVPVMGSTSLLRNYNAGVMELLDSEVTISCSQGSLTVIGGEGQMLEVISLTGKKVLEQQIDSPAQKFDLNIPKGCYIVKVGKVVRKVSVH